MQRISSLRSPKFVHAAALTLGAIAGCLTHLHQIPAPAGVDVVSRFLAFQSRYEYLIVTVLGIWLIHGIAKRKPAEPECSILWGGLGFVIAVLGLALVRLTFARG
jgi:hypothetical protein